jgi:hypothetical protein
VLVEVPVGGVTVLRGALSRAVREAAEDTGVRFEFGKALSSVTEQNGEEPPRGTLLNAHTDRYRRQLLAVHQSDPPEVTRILEASGDIGAWPVYDILSLPAGTAVRSACWATPHMPLDHTLGKAPRSRWKTRSFLPNVCETFRTRRTHFRPSST